MVGSQKGDLLEENVIFFSKQMDALLGVLFPLTSSVVSGHVSAELLQVCHVDASLFDQSEVLSLLHLK